MQKCLFYPMIHHVHMYIFMILCILRLNTYSDLRLYYQIFMTNQYGVRVILNSWDTYVRMHIRSYSYVRTFKTTKLYVALLCIFLTVKLPPAYYNWKIAAIHNTSNITKMVNNYTHNQKD